MRTVVFRAPGEIEVAPASAPVIGPRDVLIDVAACGICGSDVFAYTGRLAIRRPGTVMGHEASGIISAVGAGVDRDRVGEHVAINPVVACGECDFCTAGSDNLCRTRGLYGCVLSLPGAYANQIVVRTDNAVALPEDLELELGALVEPLAVGHHAAGVATDLGDPARVVVLGGGPIGLAAAVSLRTRGAEGVLISEPLEARAQLLRSLGFETIAPDVLLGLREFDVVVDAVGISATVADALRVVRPQGLVVFVGLGQDEILIPAHPIEAGERRIAGSAAYTDGDFRYVVGVLPTLGVETMIEDRVAFEQMSAVFAGYADRSRTALKTLLLPAG